MFVTEIVVALLVAHFVFGVLVNWWAVGACLCCIVLLNWHKFAKESE